MAPRLIRLTTKEIARADAGYTVVVRPQSKGGYMVAGVRIEGESGILLGKPYTAFVEDGLEIGGAAKDVLRMMSKTAFPGKMAGASRHR